MVKYVTKKLENGMEIIHHRDTNTSIAVVNTLYKVGSRNENPHQTGIAHLFEHLMFCGSENAPDFDEPLQQAGGENNAFTNNDITNYYNMLPADNMDTALWLESDRMAHLALTKESVDVQKKVVLEEFQEVCLNKPYGDSWHHVSALSYQNYPYRWPTIGYTPEHIESVSHADALGFYDKFYQPGNAILSIASPYTDQEVFNKVEHWFGDIKGKAVSSNFPKETALENKHISKEVFGNVNAQHIFFAFPMVERLHPEYYQYDLLSDVLGYGKSSRLIAKVIMEHGLFSTLSAYITGVEGPGLFVVEGRLLQDTTVDQAREAIWSELNLLCDTLMDEKELRKVKNKAISSMVFGDVSLQNRAMNLAYYASLGRTSMMNEEDDNYNKVTTEDIKKIANRIFKDQPYRELIYSPQPS